jgi:hypothetical protein
MTSIYGCSTKQFAACPDGVQPEIKCTLGFGHGAQIVASLRNTAINRHRLDGATSIAEACRATALTVNRRLDLLAREIPAQLTSLLINYAGSPVSKGFRADTIT